MAASKSPFLYNPKPLAFFPFSPNSAAEPFWRAVDTAPPANKNVLSAGLFITTGILNLTVSEGHSDKWWWSQFISDFQDLGKLVTLKLYYTGLLRSSAARSLTI